MRITDELVNRVSIEDVVILLQVESGYQRLLILLLVELALSEAQEVVRLWPDEGILDIKSDFQRGDSIRSMPKKTTLFPLSPERISRGCLH